MNPRSQVLIWLFCVSIATGCSSVKVPELSSGSKKNSSEVKPNDPLAVKKATAPKPLKKELRLDGALLLGQTDNLAYDPATIANAITKEAEANHWNMVRHWIRIYPDIIGQALLEGRFSKTDPSARRIAILFDRNWSSQNTNPWYDFYSGAEFAKFGQSRSQLLNMLKSGRVEEAAERRLSEEYRSHPDSIALAESLRLEGIVCLLKEDFMAAEGKLSESFELFSRIQPTMAPSVGLMLGECFRKQKKKQQWQESWNTSVQMHASVVQQKNLKHPAFWKNASFVKPIKSSWPSGVIQAIDTQLSETGVENKGKLSEEAKIWAFVGESSYARLESQNAILALKKAEAMTGDKELSAEFQLRQAKAMIAGGQSGPATAILVRLGGGTSLVSDRAKAVLGTLKLQDGSLAQGMNLLQNSISSANRWPKKERLSALADYGLAFLMRGKEAKGVSLLMKVHQEFLDNHDMDQAEQVLQNLATYYEKTEQPQRKKETIASIKSMNQF